MGKDDTNEKVDRVHDALFGTVGNPEKSLMVQILQTVKEVKEMRIEHEKMIPQVENSSRTCRNLIKCCAMAWSQVGSCWAVCNIDRSRCFGSVYLGYGGVSAHVAAPPETREMRRVC